VFLGRRQQHQTARATIAVDVANGVGGLAVRYDERFHYSIAAGAGRIVARGAIPGFERTAELPLAGSTLELELRSRRPEGDAFEARTSDIVELAAIVDGERTVLLALDGRYLSSETAESFTGRVIGLFALEGEIAVDRFDYEGSDD
jgi:hypothetical protein